MMKQVDAVLGAFETEMKAQGLWDSVAVLTISDFGRTLTSNGSFDMYCIFDFCDDLCFCCRFRDSIAVVIAPVVIITIVHAIV